MDRTILHCDCNSFYASVESVGRPELNEMPMAVCGDPEARHGVILAKNELAKAQGVKTGEPIYMAKRKCAGLYLVMPHHDKYREYSRIINEIYESYTDQVERFSIDESWLDVTGSLWLFGSGKEIADALRARVREEVGITISVGVSFNKIFAKIGSDYKKPDATTVITRQNYKDVIWPLSARDMLFVGSRAASKLEKLGIFTIGDIAKSPVFAMETALGKQGAEIWRYANGLDESPVKISGERERAKSVGNGVTFRRDLLGIDDVRAGLIMLADTVGSRLREKRLRCSTVRVQIKSPDLKVISRQRALDHPTCATREIFKSALSLVTQAWQMDKPIRMLTVTADGLAEGKVSGQLCLIDEEGETEKNERLDRSVDEMRKKYGRSAVVFASLINADIV